MLSIPSFSSLQRQQVEKQSGVTIIIETLKFGLKIFAQLSVEDLGKARLVCRKWEQLVNNIHLIQRYNNRLMTPAEIRQEATYHSCHAAQLKVKHQLLLSIVRLSIDCHKLQCAAANALMILKKIRFHFSAIDFKGIQVPGARLPRTLLDGVNFTGANLRGADLTDCSLNNTCFAGADLGNVDFGQLPYLTHGGMVHTMALAHNGDQLASMDDVYLYVWNLQTHACKKQLHNLASRTLYPESLILLFSHDDQWLFQTSEQTLAIWRCDTLEKMGELKVTPQHYFYFLDFVRHQNATYLIGAAEAFDILSSLSSHEIYVWCVTCSSPEKLDLKCIKQMTLKEDCEPRRWSYSIAPKALTLAVLIPAVSRDMIQLYQLPSLDKIEDIFLPKHCTIGNILFTPQENALLLASIDRHDDWLGVIELVFPQPVFTGVYIWRIKEKNLKILIDENVDVIAWNFLSDNRRLAYTDKKGNLVIRNGEENFKIEIREKLSGFISQTPKQIWLSAQYLYQLASHKIMVKPLHKLSLRKPTIIDTKIKAASFSTDEQFFYVIDSNRKVFAYFCATGRQTPCSILGDDKPYSKELYFRFSANAKEVLKSIKIEEGIKGVPCLVSKDKKGLQKITSSISLFHLQDQKEYYTCIRDFLACDLSHDGAYLVIASEQGFELWDTISSKQLTFIHLPLSPAIQQLILSPDVYPQTVAVIFDHQDQQYSIKIWRIDWEKQEANLIEEYEKVCDARFINKKYLFLQQSDQVMIWDFQNDAASCIKVEKHLNSFDIKQDGALMVTLETSLEQPAYSQVSLWDLEQKQRLDQQLLPFCALEDEITSPYPQSIYLSAQGQYVVSCCMVSSILQKIYVWEIKEGKLHLLWKMPKTIEVNGINLENVQNLSQENAQLLALLQQKS